jgi:hypothetical protein
MFKILIILLTSLVHLSRGESQHNEPSNHNLIRHLQSNNTVHTVPNTTDISNITKEAIYNSHCKMLNCTCCTGDLDNIQCGLPIICEALQNTNAIGYVFLAICLVIVIGIIFFITLIKFISLNQSQLSHSRNHKLYCVYFICSTTIISCFTLVVFSMFCILRMCIFNIQTTCCRKKRQSIVRVCDTGKKEKRVSVVETTEYNHINDKDGCKKCEIVMKEIIQ